MKRIKLKQLTYNRHEYWTCYDNSVDAYKNSLLRNEPDTVFPTSVMDLWIAEDKFMHPPFSEIDKL